MSSSDFDISKIIDVVGFSSILSALVIFVSALVLASLIGRLKRGLQERFPQYKLRTEQVTTVFSFMVLLLGLIMSTLALVGFSSDIIFAVGGSLAVAIGFGLKDVAASILSGFLILFERPYQVGDRIRFGDVYGDVISIGLRATQIRTLSDDTITIPNNKFLTDSVSSSNSGELNMMVQMDFHVNIGSNLKLIHKIARESIVASRYVYLNKKFVVLFSEEFQQNILYTRVRLKAYVMETTFEKAFVSDMTQRLQEEFQKHGIQQPTFNPQSL